MKLVPIRSARAVGIAALAGVALSTGACGDESAEIRTRCDGPNMIYEAWVDEPGEIGLEFRELYVVANDPRCLPAGSTPTATPQPATPQPTTS
ncbi:hypothetical protein I0C86_16570 [Plantactinospora sp. S1510]|uniref:Lipoprotein n=1 Tax=Plantactinospora alkalitolerans TaxID=2789879 RepID=A0ABS0GWI1_9ACTN|nr:hypothetical protein [Plantactinospora alkalitolerans]MBF9130564.1 hypothetical protein [Plantactinospora alkalitolerans]